MIRKINFILLCFFLAISMISCGTYEETPIIPSGGNQIGGTDGEKTENPAVPPDSSTEVPTEVEFSVSLIYNKKVFIPDEEINVIWMDDYSQHKQKIGADGFAKMMLDGDYYVFLDKAPDGYTYNPNIYSASNDNSTVEIELVKVSRTSKGRGTALYKEFEVSNDGVYRAEIKNKSTKVYYEYQPKEAGYYVIESWVNIYDDIINPKVDIYCGTFAAKFFNETLDDGGAYKKGGYTKNFKWVVRLSQAELSNVYTFAIFADSKTGVYPVNVDFSIKYEGEYYPESIVSQLMVAEEANFSTPDFSSSLYVYKNSDHGTGSYYSGVTNGTGLLNASDYKYNEETGYWHRYYADTETYGPILCAKITKPCAYYEESLNMIESHGNKNLTVSDGKENYKQFIENQYAAACNSDGVCYVTMELKEFLQKFSVSQRLFFDGNGFVESTGVYAIEEDQWLFACGYYEER